MDCPIVVVLMMMVMMEEEVAAEVGKQGVLIQELRSLCVSRFHSSSGPGIEQ